MTLEQINAVIARAGSLGIIDAVTIFNPFSSPLEEGEPIPDQKTFSEMELRAGIESYGGHENDPSPFIFEKLDVMEDQDFVHDVIGAASAIHARVEGINYTFTPRHLRGLGH